MPTLQIFISEVPGIHSTRNNFPEIEFETLGDLHEFVKQLISSPRTHDIPGGYFVINNPQHLPDSVRNRHMYPAPDRERKQCWNNADSDTDSDSEDEEEEDDGSEVEEVPEVCEVACDGVELDLHDLDVDLPAQ